MYATLWVALAVGSGTIFHWAWTSVFDDPEGDKTPQHEPLDIRLALFVTQTVPIAASATVCAMSTVVVLDQLTQ